MTRTRPGCSATYMRVSFVRHATATGLERPDATWRRPMRSDERFAVVEAGVPRVFGPAVPAGAGLVGGEVDGRAAPFPPEPLLHAAHHTTAIINAPSRRIAGR